jgi:hypothetical protein
VRSTPKTRMSARPISQYTSDSIEGRGNQSHCGASQPNNALQLTASSLRYAAASGNS